MDGRRGIIALARLARVGNASQGSAIGGLFTGLWEAEPGPTNSASHWRLASPPATGSPHSQPRRAPPRRLRHTRRRGRAAGWVLSVPQPHRSPRQPWLVERTAPGLITPAGPVRRHIDLIVRVATLDLGATEASNVVLYPDPRLLLRRCPSDSCRTRRRRTRRRRTLAKAERGSLVRRPVGTTVLAAETGTRNSALLLVYEAVD